MFAPLVPGFVGKRYGECTDGKHHLVIGVLKGYVADTQCGADVKIAMPQKPIGDAPMCTECTKLQFGWPYD